MAFGFSNVPSGDGALAGGQTPRSASVQARDGPELQEINTDQLGFSAIYGETQVKLISKAWPEDSPPPPTSSLLAVASSAGLVAAAGPDELILTSTASLREAFRPNEQELAAAREKKDKVQKVRSITPDVLIPQSNISHVAFSSDEGVLVVSTEIVGGLIAFQVSKIRDGNKFPSLRLSTNSQALRALVPNPAPEAAALFALVTNTGDLLVADLQAGQMRSGINGDILKNSVSCVTWSNKGKQLVAGLTDGTAVQMKPDGTVVSEVPRPPSLQVKSHVSSISWLKDNLFFIIYCPDDTSNGIEPSEYYIVTREPKTTSYEFQKLPEVVPPFGLERTPTAHFISRLRSWKPHILDLLIVTATTGTDVGLLSSVDKSLTEEDGITDNFTLTTISNDTRRAALPLNDSMLDTSPVGMAIDLSSKEKVLNPIPSDSEVLETEDPVPNLLILNNEGVLVSWWIIYSDSVREKTVYSGFEAVAHENERQVKSPSPAEIVPIAERPPFTAPTSTFGQSSTNSASPFGKPSQSPFASTTHQSGFGDASSTSFGKPTMIGGDKPAWATTGFAGNAAKPNSGSGFGQPAFGSPSPVGGLGVPAFGAPSSIANRQGMFGQSVLPSTSAFGKPPTAAGQASGFGAANTTSPFGGLKSATPNQSGFASFSSASGFSDLSAKSKEIPTPSPFGTATGKNTFGQGVSASTIGASSKPISEFGSSKPSPFGSGSGFKIESSFKSDGTAADDLPLNKGSSDFGFGGFGKLLSEPKDVLSPTHDKEAEMDDDEDIHDSQESESSEPEADESHAMQPKADTKPIPQTLVTPPSTLNQSKTSTAPHISSLFGTSNQQSKTPTAASTNSAWSFGQVPSTTPKETPVPAKTTLFGTVAQTEITPAVVQKSQPSSVFGSIPELTAKDSSLLEGAPRIKEEPLSDEETVDLGKIPEAPLPPSTTSKPIFGSGDISTSSNNSKSPLDEPPPSSKFLPANRSAGKESYPPALPSEDGESDELSSDFEDSGENVSGEVSAGDENSDDQNENVRLSPESSFKSVDRGLETSPTGGLFTKVSANPSQKQNRPLFGEVPNTAFFPPPKPHESPRSPSPVRNVIQTDTLRSEAARSVSAPAHPRSIIDKRKTEYTRSGLANQVAQEKEDQIAKQKAQQAEIAQKRADAQAQQLQSLEDDEDEKLRQELDSPTKPSEKLDDFITYQPHTSKSGKKSGIPAQIERLYQDINSMIYTLGINSRSLTAYMLHQTSIESTNSWPHVLKSESPMDVLEDALTLQDISKLNQGQKVLEDLLNDCQIQDVSGKFLSCQNLLAHDLFELRTKLIAIRKALHTKSDANNTLTTPLSAEQVSIQHDLRKASTAVKMKLVQLEEQLSVLRAKVAESNAADVDGSRQSTVGRSIIQKKPTVEAVTNTIAKMTSMAEKKSADIDVLEAQLKRLNMSMSIDVKQNGSPKQKTTPSKGRKSMMAMTPGSTAVSVYHTPESNFSSSVRSATGSRASNAVNMGLVSMEDKERWQRQARRKKEVAAVLKAVLDERRKNTSARP